MIETILQYFLTSLFLFYPAGLANSAAAVAAKITVLKEFNQPVDFGLQFRGKPLLGSHKTFRGFIVGILCAIGLSYLSLFIYENFEWVRDISLIDFTEYSPLLLGFLLGFGSLGGDSIKSFFKRRTSLKPGASWFPFDQIDFIIGGLIAIAFYVDLQIWFYPVTFILWLGLHITSTVIGYYIGVKDSPI